MAKTLGEKLIRAREKRGWTVYAACQNSSNLKQQSLINIESDWAEPEKLSVGTMLDIIDTFWPDVELKDFTRRKDWHQYKVTR